MAIRVCVAGATGWAGAAVTRAILDAPEFELVGAIARQKGGEDIGVALGHTLIAWRALGRGLAKVAADPERIALDIQGAWEVLGEAIQTVLRATGAPSGYERLKDFTRGRAIDEQSLAAFIETLPLSDTEKARLKALRPEGYVGLASQLAKNI